MKYTILLNVQLKNYLIIIDVKDTVRVENIMEFLNNEEISDEESMKKALDHYINIVSTDNYKPHWFFYTIDAEAIFNQLSKF